jgi:uncharacterized OsmC-like protein
LRLRFDIESEVGQNQLDQLIELTDRYCVIFQTIQSRPNTSVKVHRVGRL